MLAGLGKRGRETGASYASARAHDRRKCHSIVEISFETTGSTHTSFTAYLGNISSSGMSFLLPGKLPSTDLIISIPLSDNDKTVFSGKIVRTKEFPGEDFLEYGVLFSGRLL